MAIYLNPEAFKDKAIPPIKNKEHIINTTYSELKALVDNSQLIPGMQYRITDYITTTTQENTQSANHPFDIIIIADKINKLNCKARAVQHEGDTYFNTSQLEKWELWYDIENNIDKYVWADTVNGKGVIYRMIDAYFNDCPYDFKNIQFLHNHSEVGEQYFYTFSWIDENNNIHDCSILGNDGTLINRRGISEVYNNIIKFYYNITQQLNLSQLLNGNIFISSSKYLKGEFFGYKYNILDYDCKNNIFKDFCHNNIFNIDCYDNYFESGCCYNIFGINCHHNIFNRDCEYNIFNSDCKYNIFGNKCSNNTFGNCCNYIKFASNSSATRKYNYYRYNHFGNGCQYILFKGTQTESPSQQVQNYNIAQGLQGTSSAYLTISAVRNRNFETKVGRNSEEVIKQYCIEDLIA